jgi:O-methyltransferase
MDIKLLFYEIAKLIMTILNLILSKFGFVISIKMRAPGFKRQHFVYQYDYIRNSSLELVAREINAKGLEGAVAEVGVFRGDFAKNINIVFPERKLYLFDTFEGFDERDLDMESAYNYSTSKKGYFSCTSTALVLSKMAHPKNCIIRKGFFPETADGINEQFVFVSIDCDLYKPCLTALRFFWKGLCSGGIIFVHEYNYTRFKGSHTAVNEFLNEAPSARMFPLSDHNGTAVILK